MSVFLVSLILTCGFFVLQAQWSANASYQSIAHSACSPSPHILLLACEPHSAAGLSWFLYQRLDRTLQKQKRTPAPCVNVAVHRPHSSGFVSTTSFGLAIGEPLSVRNKYCSHFCQRSLMAVLPAGFATLKYKIQKGKIQEYKMQVGLKV